MSQPEPNPAVQLAREAALATLGEIAEAALGDDIELGTTAVPLPRLAELASRLSSEAATAELRGLSYLADILGWAAMRPARPPRPDDAAALCSWAIASGESLVAPQPERDAAELLDLLLAVGWVPAMGANAGEEIRAQLRQDAPPLAPTATPAAAPPPPAPPEGIDTGVWVSPEELGLLIEATTEQLLPVAFELAQAEGAAVAAPAEAYRREWSRLTEAFRAMSLTDLEAPAGILDEALAALTESRLEASDELLRVLGLWPIALTNYLQEPTDFSRARDLVALLASPAWPRPVGTVEAEALVQRLASLKLGRDPEEPSGRKRQALEEDVELEVSLDVLPSVLEGMLQELPGRAAELSRSVQSLVREGRAESIDAARRTAHTLKGDSNIVGVRGIANLTHALEEIFLVLSDRPGVPVPELANTLLEAADCLESMSDHVLGRGPKPENALAVLQSVLDWDNALHATVPATAVAGPPLEAEAAEPQPTDSVEPARPQPVLGQAVSVGAAKLDQMLRTTGEAIIYARQIENRAERVEAWLSDVSSNVEMLQNLVTELQQIVEGRGSGRDSGLFGPLPAMGGELDALELDRFNELHTITLRLVERIADTRATGGGALTDISELKGLLVDQDRVHLEMQSQLLETLSVPVGGLSPRFARLVRQVSRMVGKEVDLEVLGERTLIDSDILQRLAEPIAHILRNAVDHGIESPEERRQMGKPERGRVTLAFSRDEDVVTLRCRDDGRGLNYLALSARAVELGLLAPDAEPSPEQLAPLIFRSGFSTRATANQISGRGIGMDVVQASVTRLKGTLGIRSEPQAGCEITLTIPVSQILANVLLVDIPSGRQAVALSSIERVVELAPERLRASTSGIEVDVDGEWIDAVDLESRFARGPRAPRPEPQTARHGLLTRGGTLGRRVVLVDSLGDARRLILKALGPNTPTPRGVLGATILGDGTVAPVLDLGEVLAIEVETAGSPTEVPLLSELPPLPSALVVDDSLSMRRSLEHALKAWGYEVMLANDGLEAVQRLSERRPDVLLVDLEMPRMNGLELTSFVRNHPDLAKLPVIMITTRTTQRHKELAFEAGVDVLMTKPFAPDDLRTTLETRVGAETS